MDSVLLIVALGAVAAGFVQGLSGFGFGMVAMSFWAWTLEPRLAALLAVCGALTGQLVAAATVRRGFDRVRLLPFVAESHPAMPVQLVVNGVDLARWHLTAPEMQSVEAVIDANLVGLEGELKILMVALDARSPQQLGLSEDQRRLGVFVQEVCVSLAE